MSRESALELLTGLGYGIVAVDEECGAVVVSGPFGVEIDLYYEEIEAHCSAILNGVA